jgi:hypothetical protein
MFFDSIVFPQQEIHTNDRQQVIGTNAQYFDNKKVACIEH